MANEEAQAEELEVLQSIYEGDANFKQIDKRVFQYKFGTEDEKSTVLIEIQWTADYPEACPNFSLGAFYNNQLSSSAKSALITALKEEAEKNIGNQQTFTLIEWARENYDLIVTPHLAEDLPRVESMSLEDKANEDGGKLKVKKEQLTKSQKRKEWDRVDAKGEKPRGYDWIDVVKHLSQTGGSRQDEGQTTFQPSTDYLSSTNLPN